MTEANLVVTVERSNYQAVLLQAMVLQNLQYFLCICTTHLDHRTQLFVKQLVNILGVTLGQIVQTDINARMSGKCHFTKGGEQATIRTVVIRSEERRVG